MLQHTWSVCVFFLRKCGKIAELKVQGVEGDKDISGFDTEYVTERSVSQHKTVLDKSLQDGEGFTRKGNGMTYNFWQYLTLASLKCLTITQRHNYIIFLGYSKHLIVRVYEGKYLLCSDTVLALQRRAEDTSTPKTGSIPRKIVSLCGVITAEQFMN